MIQVSGLSKDYRTVSGGGFLLSDITFVLQPKAVTAILGTNGSGKSTLLKIIGGELDADGGSVKVDLGSSNCDRSADPLRNVLYLDQDAGRDLVLSMTIGENLELAQISSRTGTLRFPSRKLLRMQALDALSRVPLGLDKRLSQQVRSLSGGERQALAIARAVHFGASVLILDEPTAALGVKEAAHVLRIVLQARQKGIAVIFITHQVVHALTVGDHFAVLIRGAKAADFRKGDKTREEITDLMAGGEAMAELEGEIESYMATHDGHPPPAAE